LDQYMSQKTYPKPTQRAPILDGLRNLKMAKSAHAYVRGSTERFYRWLKNADATLPQGPKVWICGDCHVSNIGPLANADGKIDVEIRDLDQTVIGNPAHDVVRLGLSLAMSARSSDLPGVTTAKMMEELVAGYERAFSSDTESRIGRPKSVRVVVKKSMSRKWRHLAAERIEGVQPNVPLSKKFWPISNAERKAIANLVSSPEVQSLVTIVSGRKSGDDIELLDAAYWVKGCSSLGALRYAVLVRVGGAEDSESSFCLLDLKEAGSPAAPRAAGRKMPAKNGVRVVTGANALSPSLGERSLAAELLGTQVFIRELLPQDLKLDIEELAQDEAQKVAAYLGNVLGRAHARQMTSEVRAQWYQDLQKQRSKDLEAPSWLWRSVVELVETHEGAYLEHCRKFALQKPD
jgi:uncharacterized protein (DUF2252 family)